MIGTDAFQETPIVEVTRQITKHNYLVMDVRDLPRVVKEVRAVGPSVTSLTALDPGCCTIDYRALSVPARLAPSHAEGMLTLLPGRPQCTAVLACTGSGGTEAMRLTSRTYNAVRRPSTLHGQGGPAQCS